MYILQKKAKHTAPATCLLTFNAKCSLVVLIKRPKYDHSSVVSSDDVSDQYAHFVAVCVDYERLETNNRRRLRWSRVHVGEPLASKLYSDRNDKRQVACKL